MYVIYLKLKFMLYCITCTHIVYKISQELDVLGSSYILENWW